MLTVDFDVFGAESLASFNTGFSLAIISHFMMFYPKAAGRFSFGLTNASIVPMALPLSAYHFRAISPLFTKCAPLGWFLLANELFLLTRRRDLTFHSTVKLISFRCWKKTTDWDCFLIFWRLSVVRGYLVLRGIFALCITGCFVSEASSQRRCTSGCFIQGFPWVPLPPQ